MIDVIYFLSLLLGILLCLIHRYLARGHLLLLLLWSILLGLVKSWLHHLLLLRILLLLIVIHRRLSLKSCLLLRRHLALWILSVVRQGLSRNVILLLFGVIVWLTNRNTLSWKSLNWIKCHFPLLCGRHNVLNVIRLSLRGRRNEGTRLNHLWTPVWRVLWLLNCAIVCHWSLIKVNRESCAVSFSKLCESLMLHEYL